MNRSLRWMMPIRADLRVVIVLAIAGALWGFGLWATVLTTIALWAAHSFAEAIVGLPTTGTVNRGAQPDRRR